MKMQAPQLRAHCALMRGTVHEPAACFLAQKPSLLADASAQGCIGAGGRGGGGIGPSCRPPVKLLVSKLLGLTSTVLASTAVMETTTPAKTAQQVNILRQHEHEELVHSGGSSSASTTTCWYRRGWPSLPIGRLVPLSSNSPSVSGALRIRMCGGVQTSQSPGAAAGACRRPRGVKQRILKKIMRGRVKLLRCVGWAAQAAGCARRSARTPLFACPLARRRAAGTRRTALSRCPPGPRAPRAPPKGSDRKARSQSRPGSRRGRWKPRKAASCWQVG